MMTPQRALRLMIEVIFVLLGVLVVWLALAGRIRIARIFRLGLTFGRHSGAGLMRKGYP